LNGNLVLGTRLSPSRRIALRTLVCPACGLSYGSATLTQHLLSASGASCPRCGATLVESPRSGHGAPGRARPPARDARHRDAVRRTVQWAREAAGNGDYREALAWLATIEAIDAELPAGAEAWRRDWARRAAAPPVADG
jgi:hypothetical protein